MLAPRSPALALALLGACLGACFTDSGAPALATGDADASVGPTTVDPGTSTSGTSTTGEATSTGSSTAVLTTGDASTTGCVPVKWYFDIDMDGYGGPMSTEKCESPGPEYKPDSLDCDDTNPNINPAAAEVCDTVDNDCDGGIDEYPVGVMDACNDCKAVLGPTSTYYICTPGLSWDDARARCTSLLGDLVSINDSDEYSFIAPKVMNIGLRWWVGLSDTAQEGQFVWNDGTPLDATLIDWAQGEPNNQDSDFPGPANCVTLGLFVEAWHDESCMDSHTFICEAPLPI